MEVFRLDFGFGLQAGKMLAEVVEGNFPEALLPLKEKIEQRQTNIRNRDTSMDGEFIGWQIVHRYRAANSKGEVSFGNVLYILDPTLSKSYFRYSLESNDKNNLESIREVIESELGYKNNQ
ncbi:MAG: hypothetical protein K2J57_02500 [Bacteroidales bacterium]|nr:hypothetical protein [Bacteroidales bacterium]